MLFKIIYTINIIYLINGIGIKTNKNYTNNYNY